jgi:hypothetical protein
MDQSSTRFELRLPAGQRNELEDLSRQTGLSVAALARLSIARLLAQRGALVGGPVADQGAQP